MEERQNYNAHTQSHSFRYEPEKYGEVNERFIIGCAGDKDPIGEAQRRWMITVDWRKAENIDGLLKEPQPFFHDIKAQYPHYYHNVSRNSATFSITSSLSAISRRLCLFLYSLFSGLETAIACTTSARDFRTTAPHSKRSTLPSQKP